MIKIIKSGSVLKDMLFPVADEVFGEIVKRESAYEANQCYKKIVEPSIHDKVASCWKIPEHLCVLPLIAQISRIRSYY